MLAATIAVLAGVTPAYAAVTATSISSPADHSYLVWHASADTNVTVTGTAPGASDGDQVDINCYYEKGDGTVSDHQLAAGVTVASGAFTTTTSLYPIADTTCRLRAVPAGTTPTDLTPYAGPAVAVSDLEDANYDNSASSSTNYQIVGGPNNGDLYDYYIWQAQFSGAMDYDSLGECGPCDSYAIDPTALRIPDDALWYSNAALYQNLSGGPGIPDQSYAQVNGDNAYDAHGAESLYDRTVGNFDGSQDAANFPALSFSDTVDPTTGNLTINEDQDLVRCATPTGTADPSPSTANHTNCPGFTSTGVHVKRTIVQNQGGRLITVTDTYSSTDHAQHPLKLFYFQSIHPNANWGVSFPWWDSGPTSYPTSAFVPAPPTGAPVQIYGTTDTTAADGDESNLRGAMTLSAPPQGAFFDSSEAGDFYLLYRPTVPAGGSWTITQAFSTAFSSADVTNLSGGAAAAMMPSVAISAPKSGTKATDEPEAVTGTVTAGGNGLPSSVIVNGVSSPVSSSGAFSAQVPLAPGANTITASITDAGGLSASATANVSYSPPPPSSSARIKKVSADSKHLLITLVCSSATCAGKAGAVAKRTITTGKGKHRHRKTVQITVASGRFSVPAGTTQTIKLALSSAARKARKSHARLTGTTTLVLNEPGGAHSSLTRGFKIF
jgi:hypothetical protein